MTATFVSRAGWIVAGVLALFVVGALSGVVRSGPLDPPTSPQSTLPQVEPRIPIDDVPYVITQRGSYFLTKDLNATGSENGIVIDTGSEGLAVSGVTIDLNGFQLTADGGSSGSAIVKTNSDPLRRVTIKNGVISRYAEGINLSSAEEVVVSRVSVSGHGGPNVGIRVGAFSVVEDCVIIGGNLTAGGGAVLGRASVMRRCEVFGHNGNGITALSSVLIEDSYIYDNAGVPGYAGINVADNYVTIRNNKLFNNVQPAFTDVLINNGVSRVTVIDNVLSGCGGIIKVGTGSGFTPVNGVVHSNVYQDGGYACAN